MKRFLPIFVALAVALLLAIGFWASREAVVEPREVTADPVPQSAEDVLAVEGEPATDEVDPSEAVPAVAEEPSFSPEMARLVQGIHAGRTVRVQVGEEERSYLFRPKSIVAEDFKISSGPETTFPAAFEVFEGRELTGEGSLAHMAKLAVVNDTVSMAYTTDQGEFLVEREEASGRLVSRKLVDYDPDSNWGSFTCGESNGLAGVRMLSDEPGPAPEMAAVSLASEAGGSEPEKAGARADHPYFRLGPQYDASLKTIRVLMVSGTTQTGANTFSNLSSKAASYFTYAATAADVYERQLGLAYQLQELVLIASGSGEPDIEAIPNDPNDNGDDDQAAAWAWAQAHRPKSTHNWGHLTAWVNVDNASGGWVGWAYLDSYGSNSILSVSVNERAWTWGVHVHEMGHNVGASHTIGSGGAMNPSVSKSNPKEDFFKQSENGSYTAAKDIYNYMSGSSVNNLTGPADLRNPDEMPFGVDDAVSTATDTPVTFNPLTNDNTATPLFGATNTLRLVEVGQVFPKAAGSVSIDGNEITFTPVGGYTGNVWFSYTLAGDVGNGGAGWLHSADVVVTVGGNSSNPSQSPSISTTNDVVRSDLLGDVRINPLLNDEGKGRLWAGGVDALSDVDGTAESYSDGAFFLVSANVITGNGSVSLETVEMNRNASASTGNTGYLLYTPGGSEPSQVEIEYTVEDADGNQSTGTILIDKVETVSVSSNVTELVETDGRSGVVTFNRTGSTTGDEWVEFSVGGDVTLTGSETDVALAGFDSFDPVTRTGRATIPSGQSSAQLQISAMPDALSEGEESCTIVITGLESLLVDSSSGLASIAVKDVGGIGMILANESFDTFPAGSTLANGWTNEATSPGVWTADNSGTPSSGTGPANDHTQGDSNGFYLYREASDPNGNQQADLTSPTLDLSGAGSPIVEFYYHMYGVEMGELHVDVYSGGVWNLDVMPPLVGQQQTSSEEAWRKASIDVSAYKTADFQVRFRGITAEIWEGDMAIDDFVVGELNVLSSESPVISGQPQSQSVDQGDPVYLSVVAQAYPAPTYQWKKDGVDIPGATQSVLYFASLQPSDAADYTCEVTSGSTVTSSAATVSIQVNQPPVVDAGSDDSATLSEGTPWTPALISTVAWYDASDAGSVTESSGSVSQWDDKSGNDRHATQLASADRPTYLASDPMMGGRPSIGNIAASGAIGLNTPSMSAQNIYAVTYYKDGLDSSFDGYATLFSGPGLNGEYRVMGDQNTADFIGTTLFNDAGTYKNGLLVSSLSGVLPMPASLFVFKSSATRTQVFSLGYNASYSDRDWQGSYSEFIFTDGSEDLATQQQIEGYLAHKWGLADSLPGGHPHKVSPPGGGGASVVLAGSVNDPESDPTSLTWSKVSGSGTVTFSDSSAVDTTAYFSEADTYVLRLTADDGFSQPFDDVTITINAPVTDGDGDGMDDAWETLYFPGQEATIDGSADSDGDGIADFFEYLYDSDPTDAASIGFQLKAGPGGGSVVFDWDVKEGFVLGADYLIEYSTDLSNPAGWGILPAQDYTLTPNTSGGKTSLELEITADHGDNVFIRLRQP